MVNYSKHIFGNKIQQILLPIFVVFSLNILAVTPVKKPANVSSPVIDDITGDFLPDTVNVFKIAKDVSQIFADAVKFTSLNDVYGDTLYLDALFTNNYTSNDVAEAYRNDVNARIRSQRGDLGLDFYADYAENFTPGWSYDEQITYKRRVYFGVEWNVIKGGFLASRAKIDQLKYDFDLKSIDAEKQASAENYRYVFNYINYIFNKQKIDVLKERYGLVEQQLKYTTELYHLRYIGWERVLKVRAKLEDLDQQIGQLADFNQHIPNNIPDTLLSNKYSAENLPLVDVDLDKLMQIYHNNETTDNIAAIKLAMYAGGMKWWQDISLKPYLRYNTYFDEFSDKLQYGSGGVSLRVPLRFKNKRNLVRAQDRIYQAEGMSEFQAGDNELVNHYAEFAFKLKQIKEFYYKKLNADELIRKELVKKDFEDIGFNPIFTLGLIDEKKNIEAEIIDIKKLLYIQLTKMAFYLDQRSPMSFVEILNPLDFTSRYTTGVQVFVDEESFERMENHELVNYLWKNEFRDVIIEIDSWSLSPKIIDAIEKASQDHIYFSLSMKIPDGQTYPNVNSDLQEISKINNKYLNGLHYKLYLEQDPFLAREVKEVNFSDWVDDIDISLKPDDIRLSVTITDDLPMNILNRVYNKFDLVFVPSDGTPNREKLENKLIQELSIAKNKLTVVLDANDFADRLHLENYMENINKETGVENFAFSNVESMMLADLRAYEMGEKNRMASEEVLSTFRNQIFSDEQKNRATLQASLDAIKNEVQESNNRDVNSQKVNIEISDNRRDNLSSQAAIVNPTTSVKGSWQIQIAAAKSILTEQYLKNTLKVNEPISTHRIGGYYKYTFGNYKNEYEAKVALGNYKSQSGNAGAFIVKY
ncbi:MAG: hypothetical protein PF484_08830 [Bacteroidales bacterium]|jgi:hypothetical protein|nr:hypothetical protein [Bacteroidales bacterium]